MTLERAASSDFRPPRGIVASAAPAARPAPRFEETLAWLAALAVAHLAVWLALAGARMAWGGQPGATEPLVALPIAAAGCAWMSRDRPAPVLAVCAGTALLLAAWAVALTYARALDALSYDGQTYQALAILRLRADWNPFHGLLLPDVPPLTWLNHYPKAPWIWAAGIDALVGNYQAGKATNLVLTVAAGAAVASAMSRALRLPIPACLLLGALAAANPVSSVQLAEYYVDGQLGALLTVMAAGALAWILQRARLGLAMACAAAFCLANVKFTGLVYAGLLGGAVLALALLRRREPSTAMLPVLACLLGAVGPGYSPYVTNLLAGEHVFHPVMGAQRIDIVRGIQPVALDGLSAPARLARSLASETANACRECAPGQLKLPFTIRLAELRGATVPDARTGGFGPLFSGALLLAAALAVVALFSGAAPSSLGLSLAILAALVLVNPEAWWARYVPQLWLVPLTVAAFLWRAGLGWIGRALRLALVATLIADAAIMMIAASGYAAYSTRKARAQVAELAGKGPLYAAPSDWVGALQRLRDGGVAVTIRTFSPADCREVVTVLRSELQLCIPVAPPRPGPTGAG